MEGKNYSKIYRKKKSKSIFFPTSLNTLEFTHTGIYMVEEEKKPQALCNC